MLVSCRPPSTSSTRIASRGTPTERTSIAASWKYKLSARSSFSLKASGTEVTSTGPIQEEFRGDTTIYKAEVQYAYVIQRGLSVVTRYRRFVRERENGQTIDDGGNIVPVASSEATGNVIALGLSYKFDL